MSFKLQILSRSSKNWFDITPVAGTRKARKRLRAFFFSGLSAFTIPAHWVVIFL